MYISASISLTNTTNVAQIVLIPKGTAIEVIETGQQNVVTAQQTRFKLGPGETRTIRVGVYCANQNFSYPSNATGRLTRFQIGLPFENQHEVWQRIIVPMAGRAVR